MRTPAVIALELRTMRRRVKELEIALRNAKLAEIATRHQMRALRAAGLSTDAIAKRLHMRKATVARVAKEEGWPRLKGGPKRQAFAIRRVRGPKRWLYEKMRWVMPRERALVAAAIHQQASA